MDATTAVVCLAALFAVVIIYALRCKPHVKAGGRYKDGEFYIEASEKRGR